MTTRAVKLASFICCWLMVLRLLRRATLVENIPTLHPLESQLPLSQGWDNHRIFVPSAPGRRLEFVHIPKTGGTAVESAAAIHGISWGICRFMRPKHGLMNNATCPSIPTFYDFKVTPLLHKCPWWHVPPRLLELQAKSPYFDSDTFAVVRNPYDRFLSEFYYASKKLHSGSTDDLYNNLWNFNEWTRIKLAQLSKADPGNIRTNQPANRFYFLLSGHFIPQYDYVYAGPDRKIVTHVLRYEHLATEFHALMKAYNLSAISLPRTTDEDTKGRSRRYTAYNLTKENLLILESMYENDFKEWGYELVSPKMTDAMYNMTRQAVDEARPEPSAV